MQYIPAKTIVSRNQHPEWFGQDYNMNIYRGCNHGCIYCDSRSRCYQIENFQQVRAKENALTLIENELRSKTKKGVIGTGSMSDPYNPFEKEYRLTQGALERMARYGFGVAIATKSDLVVRDIDVLQSIQQYAPVLVKLTITTPHDEISRKIEPAVAPSSQRFEALAELSAAGIPCGILLMPLLPWITDGEEDLRPLLQKVKESGGSFAYPSLGLTMREGQREYFYSGLDKEYPGLRERYHARYGTQYQCNVPNAKRLWQVLQQECKRLDLLYRMKDIIEFYKKNHETQQLSLF